MNDKDYTIDDIPINRFKILKYVLKNRLSTIFLIAIFTVPFFIPLFFWIIYSRYHLFSFPTSKEYLLNFILYKNIPELFFIFLASVGLSGLYYSYRRLLFSKTLKISYHFKKGIKDSGFEFGLFSSIIYILYSIIEYFIDLNIIKNDSFISIIISIILVIMLFLIYYLLIHMYLSASLYIVSIKQAFIDAIRSAFIKFFLYFPLFIILNFPIILLIFYYNNAYEIVNYIGIISYILFSNIFSTLIFSAIIYDKFDELINKTMYKELYKVGLREYYAKNK